MSPIALFVLGLFLLLLGSQGVIVNAIKLSRLVKIPPLIIGMTIVALGTSLPEMVVSFFGGVDKASGIAIGNIIGSNVANIGLVLGISLLIRPIYVGKKKTQKNMLLSLLLSSVLFFILFFDGLTFLHGLIFILLGMVTLWWQVGQGKRDGLVTEIPRRLPYSFPAVILLLCVSLASLFAGGKLLVDQGVILANTFAISAVIIGVTAVAIGTSLPELTVSIAGLTRKTSKEDEKLVIGDLLGSNIYNILFGIGILGLFGVRSFSAPYSMVVFILFTLFFSLLLYIFRGKRIPRIIGFVLLGMYGAYIITLLR